MKNIQDDNPLFDVIAVNIDTRIVVAIYAERKTARNADAIETMAVMRRGVEEDFYDTVPTGTLKVGDLYSR